MLRPSRQKFASRPCLMSLHCLGLLAYWLPRPLEVFSILVTFIISQRDPAKIPLYLAHDVIMRQRGSLLKRHPYSVLGLRIPVIFESFRSQGLDLLNTPSSSLNFQGIKKNAWISRYLVRPADSGVNNNNGYTCHKIFLKRLASLFYRPRMQIRVSIKITFPFSPRLFRSVEIPNNI